MVYCVLPREADRNLSEAFARALDADEYTVLIERRGLDRRVTGERRGPGIRPRGLHRVVERRSVANATGRRVDERRAMALEVTRPELPRRLRRKAAGVSFFTLAVRPAELVEDALMARLIVRIQEGERLQEELFVHWFDRVFLFARASLKNRIAAEQAAQEALVQALRSIRSFDPCRQAFRAVLFGLAFDAVEARLHECPLAADGRLPEPELDGMSESELDALGWMNDDDLELLVARLPWPERPALLLRYLAKLSDEQSAEVLGARTEQVRELHDQAIAELSMAIAALGHAPPFSRRESMRRLPRHSEVLLRRRLALLGS